MRRASRHDARIGGVDAVDVGADLAVLGAERGRHRDGRRIAAAAAERRDLAPVGHALIAGDDHDLAARELVLDAERPDLDDARVDVAVVGDDARLAAGEADRVAAQLADGHREQRHRDALAGGEQHVELAPVGIGRTCLASASSSSVVSPIAETTTTTSCPWPLRAHDALGDLADAARRPRRSSRRISGRRWTWRLTSRHENHKGHGSNDVCLLCVHRSPLCRG